MPSPKTVLIVDDDESIRLVCRVNLELDGFDVREAGTIADARAAVAGEGPATVLLDVHVGPDDGLAFLAELKRDRPDLPVALLTGSFQGEALLTAGADAILAKPFELDDLRDTVRRLSGRDR